MTGCLDPDVAGVRQPAHRRLSTLSAPGRRIIAKAIRDKLKVAVDRGHVGDAAEYIYSLGKLGPDPENKKLLLDLLRPHHHRELVAHAALALDGKLGREDTAKLEAALALLAPTPATPVDPEFPDPDNRIPLYLAYLIAQNRRRSSEDDPGIRDKPMPFTVVVSPR